MPASSGEDVMMGQFWEISTTNVHEYEPRMDANRGGRGARSREETFAGAAAAKWLGCIRVVAEHGVAGVRLMRLPSGRSVDQMLLNSCVFVSIRGCVSGLW